VLFGLLSAPSSAQVAGGGKGGAGLGDFGFGGLSGLAAPAQEEPVRFSASYQLDATGRRGRLSVEAVPEPGYWIYSTTQPPGGPLPTIFTIKTPGVRLLGPFAPDSPPKDAFDQLFSMQVEKHPDPVVWTAPIAIDSPVDPASLAMELAVDGLLCSDQTCVPLDVPQLKAAFAGTYGPAAETPVGVFKDPDSHIGWRAELTSARGAPGESVGLRLTATPDPGFHIYELVPGEAEENYRTLLVIDQAGGLRFGRPSASVSPVTQEVIAGELEVVYYPGEVIFEVPITIPASAGEGLYLFSGMVGYQACDDQSCDAPLGLRFRGELEVSADGAAAAADAPQPTPLQLEKVDYAKVVGSPQLTRWIADDSRTYVSTRTTGELLRLLGLAIIGGFILNFMPCVLPVIGLKVMGFLQEGGDDPRRVKLLNLSFIAGMLSVVMLLALLTVATRSFGEVMYWGEQFGIFEFRLAVCIVLFALALSFLGVWEIPIPGFATSQTSGQLMQREGMQGAFYKGILTTVVATPCSGPLLGSVFALLLTEPAWVIWLMFLGVGFGLSLPYLVIAFYPAALGWLPKPGQWMQTLKEILAFPLLFTVVFFLTTIDADYRIAVVASLVAVWFACWWVGRLSPWASIGRRLAVWSGALGLSVAATIGFLTFLGPVKQLIRWEPYSEARLAELTAEGKTVMIDFTADWCVNCKWNLKTAIELEDVAAVIQEHGIVPLLADWTDRGPAIKEKLRQLESASIPVLAIYPSGSPDEPIILRDIVTKGQVIRSLREAGPSRGVTLPANGEEPLVRTESNDDRQNRG
jgi:thiol:disulfide interchange protein